MRAAFQRIGTPYAVTWIGVLAVIAQQTMGGLVAPMVGPNGIDGRYVEFIGIRWASLIPMTVVLFSGRLLLTVLTKSRPLPWLTIVTFLTATLASISTFNWLLILAGFTQTWNIPQRLAVAIPGQFSILIVVAVLVTYAREFSDRNRMLTSVAAELIETRQQAASRISQRQSELIETIQGEIDRELGRLETNSPQSMSTSMKHLIDDIVRPMSYQLNREVETEVLDLSSLPSPRISWSLILTRAMRRNPVHPIASTLWIGALTAAFFGLNNGLRGLAAVGAMVVIVFASFSLVRFLWRYVPQSWGTSVRAILYSAIVIATFWAPMWIVDQITGYNFTSIATTIGWLTLTGMMIWSVTFVYALNEQLRETNAELEATVDELRREVISLNNQFRLLQKGISRVLHGPVQEAISASIYRLQSKTESSQDSADDADLVADVKRRVDVAIQLLKNPMETGTNLEVALSELIELWDEVVHIDVRLSDEDRHAIGHDPLAVYAVTELIRESCGNAIRHGEAKHIDIDVTVDSVDQTISLHATNDGKPLIAHSKTGLGSQIFEEMTLEWSRYQNGRLVELNARIPLAS